MMIGIAMALCAVGAGVSLYGVSVCAEDGNERMTKKWSHSLASNAVWLGFLIGMAMFSQR